MIRNFAKSNEWSKRAEATIPLGSQTFSKSRTQYPVGISPLFIEKAMGATVKDIDGNSFVDLVSALASVTLGYNDRGINSAIRRQLRRGISFSLPGKLEALVSEKLVEMIPSAEMVRFGKNGSDATSGAIRIARAYTSRDHIAVCGYHGWHDWYIGSTTRNKGVPEQVSQLTHVFNYNDLSSLESLLSNFEIAAVILEPMNTTFPNDSFLEKVKTLTHKHGAVLIFDETITGFRLARGGAQELFRVTPDLSTFGKGMANGMPLSAIVGKKEIMKEMEEVFFSGTFGGELLSLAAASHVLDLVKAGQVVENLDSIGLQLATELEMIINSHNLADVLKLSGHNSWKFLNWTRTDEFTVNEIKTYFMQEMFAAGVLVLATHNVNLAHRKQEISKILRAYDSVLEGLERALAQGNLRKLLKVEPLEPLFRVR